MSYLKIFIITSILFFIISCTTNHEEKVTGIDNTGTWILDEPNFISCYEDSTLETYDPVSTNEAVSTTSLSATDLEMVIDGNKITSTLIVNTMIVGDCKVIATGDITFWSQSAVVSNTVKTYIPEECRDEIEGSVSMAAVTRSKLTRNILGVKGTDSTSTIYRMGDKLLSVTEIEPSTGTTCTLVFRKK